MNALAKILTERLKTRLEVVENNYTNHTKKIMQSFVLLDGMKTLAQRLQEKENMNGLSINNDLTRSFISTTSKSNFNKSKISEKGNGVRNKTPFKSRTLNNLNDKSIDKTKKSVNPKSFASTNSTNVANTKDKSSKTLISTKSSVNLMKKDDRGVSIDKLRRNLSKTPLNSDVSPINKKTFNFKTPMNISPDIQRTKSQTKTKTYAKDETLNRSKTRENVRNFTVKEKETKSREIITLQKPKTTTESNLNAFDKDFNVSKIIAVEGGFHDDSLINTKDDLLINYEMAELELSSKRNLIDTPVTSSQHLIDKEIVMEYEEVLDDKWALFNKYLNSSDQIKLLLINKKFGRYTLLKFITNLENEKSNFEEKISGLKLDSKEETTMPYSPSRGTVRALELLNEGLYNKLFLANNVPNDDIFLVYKILFQIIRHPIINVNKRKDILWKDICNFFLNESNGKAGNLLMESIKLVDFSDENIYQVLKTVGKEINKLTPNYFSKQCGTTGLVVFLVKDILEFLGISFDKKANNKTVKSIRAVVNLISKKIERLRTILNTHYNINI